MNFLKVNFRKFVSNNKKLITEALKSEFQPVHLSINDDSQAHMEEDDSHFTILIASDQFEKQSLLTRHRNIMNCLKNNGIMDKIHAVQIVAKTKDEYLFQKKDKLRKHSEKEEHKSEKKEN